jgi:glycosyltransferase involved in cell wall biosynthesis
MRIAIDISSVVYGTGVSWYTRNLVKSVLRQDKDDEFILFGGSLRRIGELNKIAKSLSERTVKKFYPLPPTVLDLLWNNLHTLPIERLIGEVDVFHSSDWVQPPTKAFKVTTIHDLVTLRYPEISHPKIVSAHKRRLQWVKKEVDRIIAVSEFTKKEIVELLDIPQDIIVVIPEAADSSFVPTGKSQVDSICKKHGITAPYLLVVGTDPRKNLPRIIEAYKIVKQELDNLELVVIGKPWNNLLTTQARFLGHVPREDMPALYTGARVLVYTSIYEGFGLPILEAMSSDCPVVTSNISSMPEVASDAAFFVDPNNSRDIALGIKGVLANRMQWIKRGRERVKKYSWIKTAEKTIQIYKEAK